MLSNHRVLSVTKLLLPLLLFIVSFSAKAQLNNALTFDGIDDQVDISYSGSFDFTTGTVEAWVKPAAYTGDRTFMSMRTNSGTRWSIHLNQGDGTVGIWNGNVFNTVTYPFQAGTWYHVAAVINTVNVEVFVNAVSIGNTGSGLNALITGTPLVIGSPNDATVPNEWFAGEIDEVRIWNDALV